MKPVSGETIGAIGPAARYVQRSMTRTTYAYGAGPRRALDVHLPEGRPAGAVLFLYGGGWRAGSRGFYRFAGRSLARRGLVTIVPDYRLFPETRWPGFLEDSAAAFAFAQARLTDWGITSGRLALAGHSAGAHMAGLLALEPQWIAEAGGDPAAVAGVAGLAGPWTFHPARWESTAEIFAPVADDEDRARPIAQVHGLAPPFGLFHGRADRTAGPHNSQRFADALKAAGVRTELRLYRFLGHRSLVAALHPLLARALPVADEVAAFLKGLTRA